MNMYSVDTAFGPVDAMLRAAQGTARLHMPGHKGLLDAFDTTELSRTDDLYAPAQGIAQAEALAAQSCGAAHTLMLTGGSTAGILAMLLAFVGPGERLLAPRRAHHAVLSACVWGGIDVVFYEDPMDAMRWHPGARAILVTRPDYYGVCAPLELIAQRAHDREMRLLVDEAHGAHLPWLGNPQSAGALGADAWVQSAHKTLPALTGAAWLHLSPDLDAARARRFLRMTQTSSPPFPILRSLDNARAWMDEHGAAALAALADQVGEIRKRVDEMEGYEDLTADDPTRLVIGTRERGYSGLEVADRLAGAGVDVEMSDEARIVSICTVADTQETLDRLAEALDALPPATPLPPALTAPPPPGKQALPVRMAALAPQTLVPLKEAVGRVASVSAGMYPPGVPLALPGEEITAQCVERLAALPPSRRFGVEDGCLICVK